MNTTINEPDAYDRLEWDANPYRGFDADPVEVEHAE